MKDVFIFCTDGLTGFPEAIEAVYPKSKIQLCIVHMIRNSTKFVNWKDRKQLCADLKNIYKAPTTELAEIALIEFAEKWDDKYPNISKMWQNRWDQITTFFAYPEDIRRVIYTTNAIGTPGEAWLSKRVKFPSGKGLAIQPELSVAA